MHANCYKNIPGVELAAVADLRPEFAQKVAAGEMSVTTACQELGISRSKWYSLR